MQLHCSFTVIISHSLASITVFLIVLVWDNRAYVAFLTVAEIRNEMVRVWGGCLAVILFTLVVYTFCLVASGRQLVKFLRWVGNKNFVQSVFSEFLIFLNNPDRDENCADRNASCSVTQIVAPPIGTEIQQSQQQQPSLSRFLSWHLSQSPESVVNHRNGNHKGHNLLEEPQFAWDEDYCKW